MGFRELARDHSKLAGQTARTVEQIGGVLNTLNTRQKIHHAELVRFVRMGFLARLRWVYFGTLPEPVESEE